MKSKGGIDIRAFSKLSDDETFQWACDQYKERIKNDDDAREKCDLLNLDDYKENHSKFIAQVSLALSFIENRKKGKLSRKAKRKKGIDIIYEDEDLLIVGTRDYKKSHEAAYLDGGTAPWCISAPCEDALMAWERYNVYFAVYVYDKKTPDSWALAFNRDSWHGLVEGFDCDALPFKEMQTRGNNLPREAEDQSKAYREMLSKIGKDSKFFVENLKKYAKLLNITESENDKFFYYIAEIGRLQKDERKYEIPEGVDVNYKARGIPLLAEAVSVGDLKMVKALVKAGANVNIKAYENGMGVFHYARLARDGAILKYLIEKGINLHKDKADTPILSPLESLAYGLTPELLDWVLEKGEKYDKSLHESPFHILASVQDSSEKSENIFRRSKTKKTVDVLLKHGIDINEVNHCGYTPLDLAISNRKYHLARYLLEKGAKSVQGRQLPDILMT